jgi:hypothetical protein
MSFKACVSCSGHGYPILMQDDDPSNHAECPSGACEQPRFAVPRAIPRSSRSVGRLWRVPFAFRIGVHKRQRRSAGKRQPADAGGWNATPALQKLSEARGLHPARLTLSLTMSGPAAQRLGNRQRLTRNLAVMPSLTSITRWESLDWVPLTYPDPAPSVTSAVYLACLLFFLAFLLLARRERL